jgi:activating signal cointegrator 1
MRCLSLWQPWATLVAIGAKECETRSWETLYRGPLAIHAAKKWNRELVDICCDEPFRSVLMPVLEDAMRQGLSFEEACEYSLPRGAIVATVRLTNCVYIEPRTTPCWGNEQAFGNYALGRFRWDLSDRRAIEPPVPCRGAQGLFQI